MFKDENLESIDIKSDKLKEKFVRDQSCQTKPIELKEKSSQVVHKTSVDVQTENNDAPTKKTRLLVDTSKKLQTFMLTVYPLISEQLTANVRSHAFDDYQLDELNMTEEISCQTILNLEKQGELDITCLSWNSIGTIVATGLGCTEHSSWCTHSSSIHLWNVNKEMKTPYKTIDVDNCITAISFHPTDPPLLVGGDFSGKIHMWDLSKEDNMLVAFSGKESESHQEPVNQLLWLPATSSVLHFISVGSDGNVLGWMYNKLKKHMGLLTTFQLSGDSIPRNVRKSSMKSNVAVGIICGSLTSNQSKDLLLGTENGCVFICKQKNSSDGYSVTSFESHEAAVTSISISKQMKGFFATCSLDMCVHVYQEAQYSVLHKLDPFSGFLLHIQWCNQSQAFYVATSIGTVLLFQEEEDTFIMKNSMNVDDKKTLVYALSVDKNDKIATADSKGNIKIWEFKE